MALQEPGEQVQWARCEKAQSERSVAGPMEQHEKEQREQREQVAEEPDAKVLSALHVVELGA